MPAAYQEKKTSSSGRGLFSIKDLKSGNLVLEDRTPFVAVLDSPTLTKACSWCFIFTDEAAPEEEVSVSACTACKIVRYCGKACQTASWKHSHKYECKIFKALYPQVLPNTARMVLQILLRKKSGSLPKEEWDEFLKLQHHLDALEKGNREGNEYYRQTLENVQLMARAGKEYSGSAESPAFVQSLVGRLITNTLTLTSPIFTPLGLVLSLQASLLNHSCEPSSAITFSGRNLSVRALDAVGSGMELTQSYINNTLPTASRKFELQNRYFFTCQCNQCSKELTLRHSETIGPFGSMGTKSSFEAGITALLAQAKTVTANEGLALVAKAYQQFNQYTTLPTWSSPFYQVRTDLIMALQANRQWVAAFIQSLILQVQALPIVYPQEAHPARVSRVWVHAKMAGHIGGLANEPEFAEEIGVPEEGELARDLTKRFGIDWGLVVYLLVKDVSDQVLKSHGIHSRFSTEVGREMARIREEALNTRGEPSQDVLQVTRGILKTVSEDGWKWWKEAMLKRRATQLVSTRGEDDRDAIGMLLS